MMKNQSGFTMIEILISMGVVAILSMVAVTIFQNTMATYNKSNNLIELQSNGGYVLSLLEQKLRDAQRIVAHGPSWILFTPKDVKDAEACVYVGYMHDLGTNPEVWPDNGYIFMQSGSKAQCASLNVAGLDGTVTAGLAPAGFLTNRNYEDSYNGVNVTNFSLTVDDTTGSNPPTVKISIELSQGVSGNMSQPRPNKSAHLKLETTISLR